MTDLQVNTLILSELRDLRSAFNEHAQDTVQRLSKVETHMDIVVGDTQPGRLTLAEKSIKELQQWRYRIAGISVGVSTVVSAIAALVFHLI